MKMGTETGVMLTQNCQGLLTASRSQDRSTGWFLPQPPEQINPDDTFILDFKPLNCKRIKLLVCISKLVVICYGSPRKL